MSDFKNFMFNFLKENIKINDLFKSKTFKFRKNTYIFLNEIEGSSIYYIVKGNVHIGMYIDDKETLTSKVLPGEFFGENALLVEKSTKEFALVASDSLIAVIPINDWTNITCKHPELNIFMMQMVLKRKKEVQDRLESVLFKDTKTRIIEFLLQCLTEDGVKDHNDYMITPMITHQNIANWVSTSRQTVTLLLNELKEKSIIEFDRKNFIVKDLEALKSYLTT